MSAAAISRAKAACEAAMRELDVAAEEAAIDDEALAFALRMTSGMLRRYAGQIPVPPAPVDVSAAFRLDVGGRA